jgi:hypothetical protein
VEIGPKPFCTAFAKQVGNYAQMERTLTLASRLTVSATYMARPQMEQFKAFGDWSTSLRRIPTGVGRRAFFTNSGRTAECPVEGLALTPQVICMEPFILAD